MKTAAGLAPPLGSWPTKPGCRFRVWAPEASVVAAVLLDKTGQAFAEVPLEREKDGYWTALTEKAGPGTRYLYKLDGPKGMLERPDPASISQPDGTHGPSAVPEASFSWTDHDWSPPALDDYVLYELHVGTFTAAGTFDAIIPHLPRLARLGVTVVQLMPIAQFPGERNWGYDGAFLYAAQHSYGGLNGLRRLVDACHAHGLAVALDVVYNHTGPEGMDLSDFGPYFTDFYRTPWAKALNFDGAQGDHVRRFFQENALFWVTHAHVDALRLDAVHAIVNTTPLPFIEELTAAVHARAKELGRTITVIAESADNDPRLIRPVSKFGWGMDAQWNDDFHHALRVALTDDRDGYYADYRGAADFPKLFTDGFLYTGEQSTYRKRRHGYPQGHTPPARLVVFSQNHDQVGNRMRGERLHEHASFSQLKLAAAFSILSPFIPQLFMGEEHAEEAPFPYFVHHQNPELVAAVRKGRLNEFADFSWEGTPPDPQAKETFLSAKIRHDSAQKGKHAVMFAFYTELLTARHDLSPFRGVQAPPLTTGWDAEKKLFFLGFFPSPTHDSAAPAFAGLFSFSDTPQSLSLADPLGTTFSLADPPGTTFSLADPPGTNPKAHIIGDSLETANKHTRKNTWTNRLDSSSPRWDDPDNPDDPDLFRTCFTPTDPDSTASSTDPHIPHELHPETKIHIAPWSALLLARRAS